MTSSPNWSLSLRSCIRVGRTFWDKRRTSRANSQRTRSQERGRLVLAVTSVVSLKLIHGQSQFFTDAGWDVHVISDGPTRNLYPATHHALPMTREPKMGSDLVALFRWVRLLRQLTPSVVMSGTPKAGLLGMISSFVVRTPTRIYLLRGLRMETSTGKRRLLLLTLEQLTVRLSTETWCVSDSLRDRCIELGVGTESRLRVIGAGTSNGVDTARFTPAGPEFTQAARHELRLSPTANIIGFMGRITPDKGLDDLIRAVGPVGRKFAVQLLIVGEIEDQEYWGRCQAQLDSATIPFVRVDHVDLPERIYWAIDIFCLPSHREGFPNVVLESLASEVPVVTTDATGCIDSVVHGTTGLVAPRGDLNALARAIEELLAAPRQRLAMGKAGRRHVQEHFEQRKVWAAFHRELATRHDSDGTPS